MVAPQSVWLLPFHHHERLQQGKGKQSSSSMLVPLTILHLIGLAKGMSFGPSHCGGLGFTQRSHTSTAISLSFTILSSTLNQGTLGISNSFSLGNLLTNASDNHSKKVLTTFLFTVEASILSLYVHAEGPY